MKKSVIGACSLLITAATLIPAAASAEQLAFPGAEGFGRYATGGRGGEIYHVTNLNDSGAGSFRDAISQPNRIIVFDVSGIIRLKSALVFKPNQTILGQTAPGEGIQIYGDRVSFSGANNIIVRYLRLRMGINGASGKDAAGVAYGRNMIFDHMSVLWGRDENFSINWDSKKTDPEPTNITIQNSIIGQGLQTHSCGGLIQTNGGVTLFRNLYIENKTRNPKVKGVNQFINNVVYNWGNGGCYILGGDSEGSSWADIQNNYFIKGNWVGATKPLSRGNQNFQYYASGNYYDDNKNGVLDGHEMTDEEYAAAESYRVSEWNQWNPEVPCHMVHPKIESMMTAEEAVKWMIDSVGPSLPVRDEVDAYLIDELKSFGPNSTRDGISNETELPHGGTGVLHNGYLPLDSDGDGISDAWEKANGLDPNDPTDAAKIAPNGYANIENYVNSFTSGHPYIKVPMDIVVLGQTENSVTIGWKDVSDNEDGFSIELSTDGKNFAEVAKAGRDADSYIIEGLKRESVYYVRLVAFNNAGVKSYPSDAVKAETTGDEVAPLACYSPAPAEGTEVGSLNDVVLSWKNDTKPFFGETRYTVYLGQSSEALTEVVKDLTETTYNLGRVEPDKTYYWRVDATNNVGTTRGEVWSFKGIPGGILFYCDFFTVPQAWADAYGSITSNTNILNAANNAKKVVGDMEFGGGATTMRIVALNLDNVTDDSTKDYGPYTAGDAGASRRAVQFVTESAGGYMKLPEVNSPSRILIYAGNASGKAQTFYVNAVDGDGNETRVASFSMAAKKRTFKFEADCNVDGNYRLKIDANGGKLNLNDVRLTTDVDNSGIVGVVDNKPTVSVYTVGDAVTVNNIPDGASVVVYDLAGRAVAAADGNTGSCSFVLASGIYVVSVEGQTPVKIVI